MTEQSCLVCEKSFDDEDGMRWNHDGTWYRFYDLGCRNKFIGNPQRYLESEESGT